MITIPKQLQNPEFRFVLLGKWNDVEYDKNNKPKYKGKAPFEKKWQENGYKFDDIKLLNHPNNFGIIGGYGNLRILDIDDKELASEFEKKLNTYTVKTGSGGRHFYFISDYNTNHVLINKLGELRANNYQVVSAPCRHPIGNYYEIIKDVPIVEISSENLLNLIKPYLREEQPAIEIIKTDKKQDTSRSGLEYRKVLALLREGKSREEIYKIMGAYSKWDSSSEQYRTLTFEKAENFYLQENEKKVETIKVGDPEELKIELREGYYNILDILDYYMDLGIKEKELIATWIIGCVFHKQFNCYPYLFFNAMKGSGKTRLMKIITFLKQGILTTAPTEAVLFRSNDLLALDEFERMDSKEKLLLKEMLNTSYKKGLFVLRSSKKKVLGEETYVIEKFETYRPIVMANIWGMDDVLGDRCISLVLEKSNNPLKTKKIEDFQNDENMQKVQKSLIRCCLCGDVMSGGIPNITKKWNFYINERYKTTLTTHTSYISYITQTTLKEQDINLDKFFLRIENSGLNGRSLELFFPIFVVANFLGEDILLNLIEFAEDINEDRKVNDAENKDVLLYKFVSDLENGLEYNSVKELTREFKIFLGEEDEEWVNSKWFGRAIKRLNLINSKRRIGHIGSEVILNVIKAKEKTKMFRKGKEDNSNIDKFKKEDDVKK